MVNSGNNRTYLPPSGKSLLVDHDVLGQPLHGQFEYYDQVRCILKTNLFKTFIPVDFA